MADNLAETLTGQDRWFQQQRDEITERGESRRELEIATAESVLALFAAGYAQCPEWERLYEALVRYKRVRGIE